MGELRGEVRPFHLRSPTVKHMACDSSKKKRARSNHGVRPFQEGKSSCSPFRKALTQDPSRITEGVWVGPKPSTQRRIEREDRRPPGVMAAERSDAQVRGGPGIVKRRGNENDRIEDRGADPGFDGEGAGHLQVRDQAAERMESAGAAAGCAGADHPTRTVGNHQSDTRSR